MKNSKKDCENPKTRESKDLLYYLFLLIFFSTNIIWVVDYIFIPPVLDVPFMEAGNYREVFNIGKMNYLIVITFIILCVFVYKISLFEKNAITWDSIILFLFIIVVLVSFYLSEYKSIALFGTHERRDGALFWIIISFLAFAGSKYKFTENIVEGFKKMMLLFLGFNIFMGIVYYLGINLMDYKLFRILLGIGNEPSNSLSGYFLGTLENPNYISGFASVVFIYFISNYLLEKENKTIDYIGVILSFILISISSSASGILTMLLIAPFPILLALIKGKQDNKIKRSLFIGLGLFFVFVFSYLLLEKFENEFTFVLNFFADNLILFLLYYSLCIFIYNLFRRIKIKVLYLFTVILFLMIISTIFIPSSPDYGSHYPEKIYSKDYVLEKLTQIENEKINYGVFSGREYMWWYTVDIIKEKPIFGYGPGTLVFEFPQSSITKLERIGDVVVTKPHSIFLELFYGSGIFAIVLFLTFFTNLIAKSINLWGDKEIHEIKNLPIIFMALAFLAQGFVNDSCIGFFPAIFVMFGVGYSRINQEMETTLK